MVLIKNNNQPIINNNPPIGVIMPSHFIPLIASTYKLPEKNIKKGEEITSKYVLYKMEGKNEKKD